MLLRRNTTVLPLSFSATIPPHQIPTLHVTRLRCSALFIPLYLQAEMQELWHGRLCGIFLRHCRGPPCLRNILAFLGTNQPFQTNSFSAFLFVYMSIGPSLLFLSTILVTTPGYSHFNDIAYSWNAFVVLCLVAAPRRTNVTIHERSE